jgi:hypothetical protein
MSYREYLRDAEEFYERGCESLKSDVKADTRRCFTASVLLSFISLESFINNMMEGFAELKEIFSIHEIGFLKELSVQLENSGKFAGEFIITNKQEYKRLEDKILFLIAKFSDGPRIDKGSQLWQNFMICKDIRDKLAHPRENKEIELSSEDTKLVIDTITDVIKLVAGKVWKQKIEI